MKTLSFDTYSFMPYGNLQSKDIYIYITLLVYSISDPYSKPDCLP